MKKLLLIGVLLVLSGSTAYAQDPWTKTDTGFQMAWFALHAVDWGQTAVIPKHPERFAERNPILGRHPSSEKVHAYMAASALVNTGIAYLLPQPYRRIFQTLSISMSGFCVVNNYSVGLKVRY